MKTLMKHQKEGIDFLASHQRAFLLDEMGLGKTGQAIMAAAAIGARRVVVVCPALVKHNWQYEIKDWLGDKATAEIINGRRYTLPTLEALKSEAEGKIHFFIVNYDILNATPFRSAGTRPDCIIFDESHYLKNEKARRTKQAKELVLSHPSAYVWALTGTPIMRRPVDFAAQIDVLGLLRRFVKSGYINDFKYTYCNPRKVRAYPHPSAPIVWAFDGVTNADRLRSCIDGVALRRQRSDVLDLPPKVRNYIIIEDDGPPATTPLSVAASSAAAVEAPLRAWLEGWPADRKLVIFAWHHVVIDMIASIIGGGAAGVITGATPQHERARLVEAFQEGEIIYLICQIDAGGVGITLTAASDCLFAELPWNPAQVLQAEDRLMRIGQNKTVYYYYMITRSEFAKTVSERKKELIEDKHRMAQTIISSDGWGASA